MQTFHWLWVLFVLVVIVIALLQGLKEYLHNEKQPKITSVAKVLMIDRKDSKVISNQTFNMSMVYHRYKYDNVI